MITNNQQTISDKQ